MRFILLLVLCIPFFASSQTNTFPSSGNVGIGTTSPSYALHVLSQSNTGTVSSLIHGQYYGSQISTESSSSSYYSFNVVTGTNTSGAGGTSRFYVRADGNVGIGTTSPRGIFDVGTDGDVYLASSPNTGTDQSVYLPGHIYIAPYNGGNVSYLQARRKDNSGSTALQIRTYNSGSLVDAMYITPAGDVGIGTHSPQGKFAVNGDIYSQKVKVTQTGWSDYVFYPDYKLPSLKDVENFIKQHKHLPEVPSASEVEKDGLNLGDNQATLLKKIEELTLYIIEQDKEIQNLKSQNKDLLDLKNDLESIKTKLKS